MSRAQDCLLALGLFAVLALALACGSNSDAEITEAEASDVTNRYLATTLGLFTGTTAPQAYIDQFAPECRTGVDATGLAFVVALMQGLTPELRGLEVQAVDAGELQLQRSGEGVRVSPRDPAAMRIQVDGAFEPASQFFARAGFSPSEGELPDSILLVRRGGTVYLGNCDELRNLANGISGF